jgi:hypothetical protein
MTAVIGAPPPRFFVSGLLALGKPYLFLPPTKPLCLLD